MDRFSPPVTTHAKPARDEAKAHCAKDLSCRKAVRNPVTGREAEAGSSKGSRPARAEKALHATRGGSRGGAGHMKGTFRPLPSGSKRGRANLPARGSIGVGAPKMAGAAKADSHRVKAGTSLPNPAASKPITESVQKPSGSNTQTEDDFEVKVSRRQKKKANALKTLQRQNAGESSDEPAVAPKRPQKRNLGGSGDSPQTESDSKRTRVGSYAEALTGERVAVIPESFPAEMVLVSHVGAIQEAVITRLLEASDPLPKITFGNIVGGALHISCGDKASSTWLSSVIGEQTIAGLSLKVVDARDLPKPVKMAWKTKIHGIQDNKRVLGLLQRVNPSLHTELWKVVDVAVTDASSRRIILMDRESADVIRDAGYKLHSGIDVSTFKLLEDVEERGVEGADDDPKVAPNTDVATAAEVEGAAGAERVDEDGREGGCGASRGSRATSPISVVSSEDLRELAALYLDGRSSPMSQDAQEDLPGSGEAADLSMPKQQ